MGLFSSILSIGGGIVGAIYGGPAGAAAGSAIGGGIGGAVDGGGSTASSGGSATGSVLETVGTNLPGLVGGIAQNKQISTGNALSQYAIDMQIAGQRETNAQNLDEAMRNRAFQHQMSSTAHQREIDDLKKAGLNPILSVTGGAGAATTQGSMATLQNPYDGMAGNVNEARKIKEVATQQLKQEQQRISNENKLAESAIQLNKSKAAEADSSKTLNEETSFKKILEMDTEVQLKNRLIREQEEIISKIQNNSAQTVKALSEKNYVDTKTKHENLSLRERDYLSPLKKWTGPAREIFNSAEDAVDVINPFNSRTTIHRYE